MIHSGFSWTHSLQGSHNICLPTSLGQSQVAFRIDFKMLTAAKILALFDSPFSLRLHLPIFHFPLRVPWLTSLWSLNLWRRSSLFWPQVLDSCCSHFLGGLPFLSGFSFKIFPGQRSLSYPLPKLPLLFLTAPCSLPSTAFNTICL